MVQTREQDYIPPGSAESLPPASEDLNRVLERLERSLQVDLVATYQPTTCAASDRWSEVLLKPETASFDQFPVQEGDRPGTLAGRLLPSRHVGAAATDSVRVGRHGLSKGSGEATDLVSQTIHRRSPT